MVKVASLTKIEIMQSLKPYCHHLIPSLIRKSAAYYCEDAYLRLIQGKFGEFYSCRTDLGCNVGKARVCPKCRAPSVDARNSSVCNNVARGNSMKICEKCGRPLCQTSCHPLVFT